METLEFWPRQSHHLLQSGGRTVHAGETFDVSAEDVDELLASDEIRRPVGAAGSRGNPVVAALERGEQGNDATDGKQQKPQPSAQSPVGQSATQPPDRRS